MHGFSGHLGLKWGFWGQNRERIGAILTPNELVITFGGSYVCANFGENRSRNATVRVLADGQTDRQTDRHTHTHKKNKQTRKPIYNLSRCYML